ncbi:hypothetical protein HHL25_22320 [Rhizobium sp. S-51]|uniref:Uncharacterized protein n=1 Tax=Rhizobium terricola TaxID=2728849 RepID=A0A7Y0B0G4_9HYPH|nr:hypothetical protein [Rhizobium terricola]NML76881.1 hypothetical protein [Rhizobium terricola]
MIKFDYTTGAGLFVGRKLRQTRGPRYRRFDTAAEAVRFAIEEIPGSRLLGSVLEVDDDRFDDRQIRMLYDDPGYPFARREK